MPTTTLVVPTIHCALCRAELVAAATRLGATPVAAAIGSDELVVECADDGMLRAVAAAVAAATAATSDAHGDRDAPTPARGWSRAVRRRASEHQP